MFKYGFDNLADNAPSWYVSIDTALEKENFIEALRIARDAVQKCKDSGERDAEVIASCACVKVLLAEEDTWNARKGADEAVAKAKAANNKKLEAAATHLLAKTLLKDRKADDARKLAQNAEGMYKEVKDARGELSVTITNAAISVAKKNLLDAQRVAEAAKATARSSNEKAAELAALYVLYQVAVVEENIVPAVEALDAIFEFGDASAGANAQLIAAGLMRDEGQLQEATDRAVIAADAFDTLLDANKKGLAVLILAKALNEAKQYQDASEAAEGALQLFKHSRNKTGQAESLRIIADYNFQILKDNKTAIYQLEEVSFLYRQAKSKKNEADALNEVTKLQFAIGGDLSECLRRARRAAQLYDEDWASDTIGNAEANMTVAQIYLQQNDDLDEAATFAKTSKKVYQKLENKTGEVQAALVLSRICFANSEKEEGSKNAEKALELAKDINNKEFKKAAMDLVEYQGKKKPLPSIEHADIIIFHNKTRMAFFDEFESRRARHMVKAAAAAAEALKDGPKDVEKQKAEFTIRWQLVPNLNLSSMPVPR